MITETEIAIQLKLKELATSIIQSEYCITANDIFITREIDKKDLQNINEQNLDQTAKEIADNVYNQVYDIQIHLAASESYAKNPGLASLVSKFTHETVTSMLFDFLKRKNQSLKCFCCTLLFEALSLNTSQHYEKTETRNVTITSKSLISFGFLAQDIAILKILTTKNSSKSYQPQDTTELLDQLKKINPDEAIIFTHHNKEIIKALYDRFLFNLEDRQLKINYFKSPEKMPLLETCEIKYISLSNSLTLISVRAKSAIQKRFYQYLRANVTKTIDLMAYNSIILELDFSLESEKNNVIHFSSEEQFKLASNFHNKLLEDKFKKLINLCPEQQDKLHDNEHYQQLITFIVLFAINNSIFFEAAINHNDILFLKTLYATNPEDIGCVSDNDLDCTNYGIKFDIATILTACTSRKANKQFYTNLLHLYRLPNTLLKAALLIAKEHIHTGRIRKLSYDKSQGTLNQKEHKAHINNQQIITIDEINTLYIQMLNPRFMAVDSFIERLQLLTNAGCSLKDCDVFSKSILHMLILYEREDLIYALLNFNKGLSSQQQLDFNQKYIDQYNGTFYSFTALNLAVLTFCSAQIISALLTEGCNLNITDLRGMSALHYAVILGRAEIIDLFYRRGANHNIKDSRNLFPLDYLDDFNVLTLASPSPATSFYQAIMQMGSAISFEYNRSISAKNNHLLLEPDQNVFFGYTDNKPDEQPLNDPTLFPMKYAYYYDEFHQYTENLKDLFSALDDLQCTDKQRKYILTQIGNLDAESRIDFIISERLKLQELFKKLNYNVTEFFTTLTIQQEKHLAFNNSVTDKSYENSDSAVRYIHKGIITIDIQRQNGKYNFILFTSDKAIENNLAKELASFSHFKRDNKFYINELNRSQFSLIFDKVIKAAKQTLLPSINGFYHRRTNEKSSNLLTETTEQAVINTEYFCTNLIELD